MWKTIPKWLMKLKKPKYEHFTGGRNFHGAFYRSLMSHGHLSEATTTLDKIAKIFVTWILPAMKRMVVSSSTWTTVRYVLAALCSRLAVIWIRHRLDLQHGGWDVDLSFFPLRSLSIDGSASAIGTLIWACLVWLMMAAHWTKSAVWKIKILSAFHYSRVLVQKDAA
jgi:hypothetical protein